MKGLFHVSRNRYGTPDGYYVDGRKVSKAVFDKLKRAWEKKAARRAKAAATAGAMPPKRHGHWPMKSVAMAVHPKQIELARKLDADRGAPATEYTARGRPIFTSESHKRAFIKAHGFHDNNSYC